MCLLKKIKIKLGFLKNIKKNGILYVTLNWIYRVFSKAIFWIMRYVCLVFVMFCEKNLSIQDIPQIFLVNKLLNFIISYKDIILNNQSNIITIVTVLWAFTTAMAVFFIERLDQRFYGIRMADLMLSHRGKGTIVITIAGVMTEPLFLLLAVSGGYIYTTIVIGLFVFLSMLYVVLMIFIEISSCTTIEYVIEQLENGKISIVYNFFRNTDYNNDHDRDVVYNFLLEDFVNCNCDMQKRSYEITHYIMSKEDEFKNRYLFIKNWITSLMDGVEKDDKNNPKKNILIKKGIFLAIIETIQIDNANILLEMLDIVDQRTADICLWCIACNIYFEQFEEQRWRKQLTQYLLVNEMNDWTLKEEKALILNFKEVYDQINYKYTNTNAGNYDYFSRIYNYCTNV